MMRSLLNQRGATLFVTLVALIIATLLALVAIRSSSIGLRIGGNVQSALEAQAAAQAGIDQLLGDINTFIAPPAANTNLDVVIGGRTYKVVLPPPRCLSSAIAPGYSLVQKPGVGAPLDQIWNVAATASEGIFSASVSANQGIKVRMPVGTSCPN